jgi:hypothetical protein
LFVKSDELTGLDGVLHFWSVGEGGLILDYSAFSTKEPLRFVTYLSKVQKRAKKGASSLCPVEAPPYYPPAVSDGAKTLN